MRIQEQSFFMRMVNMIENLRLVEDKKNYKVTRIGSRNFAEEIIIKSSENILKDYIYVETRRIIA